MPFVETERESLIATLRATEPDAPTLCQGWDVRHLLGHLVQREHDLIGTVGDAVTKPEPSQEKHLGKLAAAAGSTEGYKALVSRFAAGPPRWSPMSWAGEQVNLLEYVIHHEDVRRGAGPVEPRALSIEQSAAVWKRLPIFARLAYWSCPVGVVLERTGGAGRQVRKGAESVTLTGEPIELALYVSGRRGAARVQVGGAPAAVERFESWAAQA